MEQISIPERLWLSSAEQIGGNNDILSQILLRLPLKSIAKFKSVNSQWHDLILVIKPSIAGLFYNFNNRITCIPFEGHSAPALNAFKNISREKYAVRVHDSRNGLVLCSFGPPASRRITVYNPKTHKYKTLPKNELGVFLLHWYDHLYLYFDPSLSPIYKVILIKDMNTVFIFASNNSAWKKVCLEEVHQHSLTKHGLLSSDGVIHMLTFDSYHVQFNVATEQYSMTFMTFNCAAIGYFGECDDGKLVLVLGTQHNGYTYVYEMDYKLKDGRWVFKHKIDLTEELWHSNIIPTKTFDFHLTQEEHEIYKATSAATLSDECSKESKPMTKIRIYFQEELQGSHVTPMTTLDCGIMRVFLGEETDLTMVIGLNATGNFISYNHKSKEIKILGYLPSRVDANKHHDFSWELTYRDVHPFIESITGF